MGSSGVCGAGCGPAIGRDGVLWVVLVCVVSGCAEGGIVGSSGLCGSGLWERGCRGESFVWIVLVSSSVL